MLKFITALLFAQVLLAAPAPVTDYDRLPHPPGDPEPQWTGGGGDEANRHHDWEHRNDPNLRAADDAARQQEADAAAAAAAKAQAKKDSQNAAVEEARTSNPYFAPN